MAEYIDRTAVLKVLKEQRDLALQREYDTPTNSPAYTRYSAQARERSRFYDFISVQPTADVIPLEKIKELRSLALRVKHNTGSIDTLIDTVDRLIAER
mgnify:CR=1 FL=1